MTNIAWAITGGGSYIRELAKGFLDLKKKHHVKITVFASKWGYEVARIYGVTGLLNKISPGKYREELLVGDKGFYYIGRFSIGVYKLLVIAPTTSNSIAKMVHGIADTLPTAAFAQATKSDVPVIVLPTDIPMVDGYAISYTPCYIDQSKCMYYQEKDCPPARHCPVKAIEIIDDIVRIDLMKCIGCMECIRYCRYNAIACWREIRVKVRDIDLGNIEKLKMMKNVYVVKNVDELFSFVKEIIGVESS